MSGLTGILEAIAGELGPRDGEPVALDGGITNRNYRVRFGACDYVVRLPGKDTPLLGINREAERLANEAAASLGIAPSVAVSGDECLVTTFIDGGPLTGDELRRDPAPVARKLRRFHDSGVRLPVRFWVPELLDRYARIVADRGGSLPDGYAGAVAIADRIGAALPLSDPAPCHNDLLEANLLVASGEPVIVDWEYAGMGHRLFDLGNLAVNNGFDARTEDLLLEAYFGEPPDDRRRAQLHLMRLMSDAREGAWGVVQSVISELEFDFVSYAEMHFARLAGHSELEEWLDAATA